MLQELTLGVHKVFAWYTHTRRRLRLCQVECGGVLLLLQCVLHFFVQLSDTEQDR